MKKIILGFILGGISLYITVSLKPSLVITAEVKPIDTIVVDTTKVVTEISPVLQPSTVLDTAKRDSIK